jgi:hypothetical protein
MCSLGLIGNVMNFWKIFDPTQNTDMGQGSLESSYQSENTNQGAQVICQQD